MVQAYECVVFCTRMCGVCVCARACLCMRAWLTVDHEI